MNIVTIDFETYYSRDYSLSKMTTEEYIRSFAFQVIGMGIKVNDQPAQWYDNDADIMQALITANLQDKAVLCHNTIFDGAILAWRYGIRPKLWLDTLSMARPLHNITTGCSLKALGDHYGIGVKGTEVLDALGKRHEDFSPHELRAYGNYCINDVEMTYKLFHILKHHYKVGELQVVDLLIRMYTEPMVELDSALLQHHLKAVRDNKESLLKALAKNGGEDALKDILMSNDKFAALLKALKVEPPTKISVKTGKQAWAFSKTDEAFTSLLDHPNPKVQAAVSARLGTKSTLEETRTQNLIQVALRGRLPIMLNYWGAHTGRLCLVGDTVITVIRMPHGLVLDIILSELLPDDLVWDGEAFVSHGGLIDQGIHEVMTYDGITGTPDHRVYCEELSEAVELRIASERGYTIKVADIARSGGTYLDHSVDGRPGGQTEIFI